LSLLPFVLLSISTGSLSSSSSGMCIERHNSTACSVQC
jgi:hypothetical protein